MIIDLSCPIEMRGYELLCDDHGSTRAYIRLYNLTEKVITGYSATIYWFNELTQASVTENITVDEMRAAPRSGFKLVHSTQNVVHADHVEMYFSSVNFEKDEPWVPRDGAVVDIGEQPVLEGEELDLLKQTAGEDAVQFPQIQNKFWRCVCGRINLLEEQNCVRCGRERNTVLKNFTEKGVMGKRKPRVYRPPQQTNAYQEKRKKRRSDALLKGVMIALLMIFIALVAYGIGKGRGNKAYDMLPEPVPTQAMYEGSELNAYSPYFSSNIPS